MPAPLDVNRDTVAAALDHVESLPLGEAVILHNRESGAIVATNAFGAMLIDALRRTPDTEAVVRRTAVELEMPEPDVRAAVETTLARWHEDGVFLTAVRPFPMAIPYRPTEGATARRLQLGTRTALIQIESAELARDIDRALAPMRLAAEADTPGAAAVRLDVVAEDHVFGVFRDDAPVWGAAPYELTRFHLLREIMDILCGPERISAHLHASAVAVSGAGLVFAGASGSGKSTLATSLIGAGAALVSDDHVAIDTDGAALLAFPTRPNLKQGGHAVPQVDAVIADHGGAAGDYVPRRRRPAGEAVPLAGFVFPRYAPDADNKLSAIDPAEALRELIQTGSRVSRSTRSIAPLVQALRAHPTRVLSYRDTDFAVDQCLALVGG